MFQSIIQNAPLGVLVVDAPGNVVFCNASAEAMLPWDTARILGARISDILPQLLVSGGKLLIAPTDNEDLAQVIALPSPKGPPRHAEVQLSQLTDETGATLNIATLNEVTSRMHAWQAIKDQEERWNLALQGSQIGVFESDLRTGAGVASDSWYHLLGISNIEGRNSDEEWRARVHPDDLATVEAIDAQCIEGRTEKAEAKFRMKVGDGTWHWMRSILRVTERDEDGNAVRLLGTMIDITPLETALELAKARKAGLEMLIANAPVAMAVLALDGTFLLLNDACYPLLGHPRGRLEQQKFWKLLNAQMLREIKAEVDNLIQGKTDTCKIEQRYIKPDGDAVDIVIRISLIRRDEAEETRLIVQMVDITENKRLDALKDDFVATVSHELRTPLASVYGALSLLAGAMGDNASEQARKLLSMAQRNSTRLIEVVDDLLDFQKLTTGHFSIELAKVDIRELVRQVSTDNELFAKKFDVCLALQLPDHEVFVKADALRLRQVVTNLLSNAAKFSPTGGRVLVRITNTEHCCTVCVSDNGRGISSEFGERIFRPFSQQSEHLTRDREGSGLGLAISKGLVERMSGEIGYTSEPNVETTFWIRLPLWRQD
ncbi:PAS domain-containing sensor histidine kinase [Pseudosulfitobacter koreensis]|uniref:histidine kinase n=1 Tax=Pseudosulfitobacter koreensis TaxID=2968472 RepID=A0ABT1Z459_9RHOB|nr:ATP-binding protein [Pseudosulfitobacter koreense]MCR8827927.1 PAS domain S-box protein [Pseudosulfitobacter koreense]